MNENTKHFEFDEAKLTAYALGELEGDERAAVEAAVEADDALRAEVESIRAAASMLEGELGAEPELVLTEDQRETIAAGPKDTLNDPTVFTTHRARWFGSVLAAAAMIALTATAWVYWERAERPTGDSSFAMRQELAESPSSPAGRGLASVDDEVRRKSALTAPTELASPEAEMADTPDAAAGLGLDVLADRADEDKRQMSDPNAIGQVPIAAGERANEKNAAVAQSGGRDRGAELPVHTADQLALESLAKDEVVAGGTEAERIVLPDSMGKGVGQEQHGYAPAPAVQVPARRSAPPASEPISTGGGAGGGQNADTSGAWTSTAYHKLTVDGIRGRDRFENAPELDLDAALNFGGRTVRNNEGYAPIIDNPWVRPVGTDALSTFSIDVDTASYANIRRFITSGELPPKDAVRIEEMINYFEYDYAPPADGDEHPFATHIEIADAPWNPEHRLVRIGLKGREIEMDRRPSSNLVFLIDVSGSMKPPNKLPLLKQSMTMLVDHLNGDDTIAIVTYAGNSGLALPPTHCDARESILGTIDRLEAGGSTNGGAGIELAYRLATENFIDEGVNRVILATDGDFNVGLTAESELLRLIEAKRETGVFLSVLGFGEGNIKDNKMELLADTGNGNYAYIDGIGEARKVLVEQATGTLVTIAKDVKIQVEFNPAKVGAYRLIGYANRMLEARDFNDDRKDAGEIGAGHTVTALYEVVPPGVAIEGGIDDLKYQPPEAGADAEPADMPVVESDELFTLKLRYKQPDADESTKIEIPVVDEGRPLAEASEDFTFASAVAAFGMVLRDSEYRGSADCDLAIELALAGSGDERARLEAVEYLEDFVHYALTANVELAAANAKALLKLDVSDPELALLLTRSEVGLDQFRRAVERAKQIEALAELADELDRRITAGLNFLARVEMAPPKPSYRGEFVELVRKAKQLGAP